MPIIGVSPAGPLRSLIEVELGGVLLSFQESIPLLISGTHTFPVGPSTPAITKAQKRLGLIPIILFSSQTNSGIFKDEDVWLLVQDNKAPSNATKSIMYSSLK